MRKAGISLIFVPYLLAQQPTRDAPKPASISGLVRDAKSGAPVINATVSLISGVQRVNDVTIQSKKMKLVSQTTDSMGHYEFSDVTPGECHLSISTEKQWLPSASRTLNISPGQQISYDISVKIRGTISGKVMDENGEPVPEATVFLVGKEYHAGAIRTLIKQISHANDLGEYTLVHVDAGRPFLILADNRKNKLDAKSQVPENPKMRRQVLVPTFYPNSPDLAGAASLTLSSGQHLERVDVKLAKAPGFCLEGSVEREGIPGPLRFEIAIQQPSFGTGANGGMYSSNPGGVAGKDGKIRICDLTPGFYTVQAIDWPAGITLTSPPAIGTASVSIGDRDIKGIKVEAIPPRSINGEVVLEGKAPPEPISGTLPISLNPLVRAHFPGEQISANSSVPGTFALASVPEGEYSFFPATPPNGYFVRDITYAGISVLRGTIRVGSAMGDAGLRVMVSPGPGKIEAIITDDKDKSVAGVNVVAMPVNMNTEADLAATLVKGSTDQDGKATVYRLSPGKYHVLAFFEDVDMTPELVNALWKMRVTKGKEIDVEANGTSQVQVKVSSLQ